VLDSVGQRQQTGGCDRGLSATRFSAHGSARISAVPDPDVRVGWRMAQITQAQAFQRSTFAVGSGRPICPHGAREPGRPRNGLHHHQRRAAPNRLRSRQRRNQARSRICKVESVSGQDTIENRSNIVTALGRVATRVVATGEPLWYEGRQPTICHHRSKRPSTRTWTSRTPRASSCCRCVKPDDPQEVSRQPVGNAELVGEVDREREVVGALDRRTDRDRPAARDPGTSDRHGL
jgi:hypothetical protein